MTHPNDRPQFHQVPPFLRTTAVPPGNLHLRQVDVVQGKTCRGCPVPGGLAQPADRCVYCGRPVALGVSSSTQDPTAAARTTR